MFPKQDPYILTSGVGVLFTTDSSVNVTNFSTRRAAPVQQSEKRAGDSAVI